MLRLQIHLGRLLQQYNITQVELAERIGIEQNKISRMVNAKNRQLSLIHVEKIINEFNIKDISRFISIVDDDKIKWMSSDKKKGIFWSSGKVLKFKKSKEEKGNVR